MSTRGDMETFARFTRRLDEIAAEGLDGRAKAGAVRSCVAALVRTGGGDQTAIRCTAAVMGLHEWIEARARLIAAMPFLP